MQKNYKIIYQKVFPEIKYIADFVAVDKMGNKTVVEVKTTKKKKKEKDFTSIPESITANGNNFDDVICNNKELRQRLNKILKPLLKLKLVVITPKWIKNLPEDAYERLRQGWDRGSYRNLWPLRKKWPKKAKYLMLQDLTFNKFFSIHGREVGKGPSNILPFLAQILSTKPNLTYLIQELENNWHPQNQRKIIETIVDIMKKSEYKNFVLETHSELFIITVQKLVQKGILKPEEVSINYISRSKDGSSNVHHIPINSQGGFKKAWPGGFFNERMEILRS